MIVPASVKQSPGMAFRNVYSTLLLIFCTIIVIAVIIDGNTKLASVMHPSITVIILFVGLIWLSMVEGGQASLVGLPPVQMSLYEDSHPSTHRIMKVVNRGDNLDRYLMGRQFLVLALVFVENLCGDPLDMDKSLQVLGMPIIINKIFLNTGLALFFMTAMLGKISAQVIASRCMLDYVNTLFALFTFQISRLIEASGLLHCCYLSQTFFSWAAGQPLETKEANRSWIGQILFWGRVLMSLAILGMSFAVTLSALFHGQTTMWDGVPNGVAVVLFFVFMMIVVTTIELPEGDENIFGVSDGMQALFDTGLLGALITTIVASITWQLVASAFPMAFLSTPITFFFMRFCLFLEWTGLCQGSWVVATIQRNFFGFKRDEVYIGTAEERAALRIQASKDAGENANTGKSDALDEDGEYNVRPGHLYPGVPTLPPDFSHRTHTLEDIEELEGELTQHMLEVENRLKDLQAEKDQLLEMKRIRSAMSKQSQPQTDDEMEA